jgi:hypothetical protein
VLSDVNYVKEVIKYAEVCDRIVLPARLATGAERKLLNEQVASLYEMMNVMNFEKERHVCSFGF